MFGWRCVIRVYGDNRHGGDRGGRSGYGGRDGRNREYDRRSGTGRSALIYTALASPLDSTRTFVFLFFHDEVFLMIIMWRFPRAGIILA